MRVAQLYISPDPTSAKLGDIERGREVIILETSREWLHVEANVTEERTVTGWMVDKGVLRASTPDGDKILYGEAVDSEDQGSQRRGRRGAAQDAMRLYYRVSEYFPKSPLAGEALYRSADIRWQIEKSDVSAFHLIDNKLCGDWQGSSKCPTKEAEIYEKYASEHPQSPAAAEALYDAAWRWSALIEIYKPENELKKSEESKSKAIATAQKVVAQSPQTDWGARAQRLLYLIQQNIPTFGNTTE